MKISFPRADRGRICQEFLGFRVALFPADFPAVAFFAVEAGAFAVAVFLLVAFPAGVASVALLPDVPLVLDLAFLSKI